MVAESADLSDSGRYLRQAGMLGEDGQRKLKEATVFVAGIGGLGGTAAMYLAAAGIGRLILAHEGVIALPDLNRQILMKTDRLGDERIACAVERLREMNPEVDIEGYAERISYKGSRSQAEAADIVIDARYDFPERYALNRICFETGKPMVEAAMYGYEISLTTLVPGVTPCLSCLYPDGDRGWKPLGFPVLGAVSGLAGCMAALEAVKWITGEGDHHVNTMYRMNGLTNQQFAFSLKGTPMCPSCKSKAE